MQSVPLTYGSHYTKLHLLHTDKVTWRCEQLYVSLCKGTVWEVSWLLFNCSWPHLDWQLCLVLLPMLRPHPQDSRGIPHTSVCRSTQYYSNCRKEHRWLLVMLTRFVACFTSPEMIYSCRITISYAAVWNCQETLVWSMFGCSMNIHELQRFRAICQPCSPQKLQQKVNLSCTLHSLHLWFKEYRLHWSSLMKHGINLQ